MLSSVEKLHKIFKLERERGYDNRAVVGGLEKLIPSWENEARLNKLDDSLIKTVSDGLHQYANIEPENRDSALNAILKVVENPVLTSQPLANGGHPAETEMKTAAHPVQVVGDIPAPPISPAQPKEEVARENQSPNRPPIDSRRTTAGLNAPLTVIHGIGVKHAQTLERLGLHTLEDLLYYFPRRYDDYSQLKPINRLVLGEEVTVIGTVLAIQTRPIRGGKMQLVEAILSDGTGKLRLSWFNQPWLVNQFRAGAQVVVSGKLEQYLGNLVMKGPEIEEVDREHLHTNRIVPVYSLTAGITQKWLRRLMYSTVTFWAPRMEDYLPVSVRNSMKLVDLGPAIMQTQFPDSQDALEQARWRLAFDEIFLIQLGVLSQKRNWQSVIASVFNTPDDWLETQISRLPYPLTGAQRRAVAEIQSDLTAGRPMNRLLQGDVGSGKTVVAALAFAMINRHEAQSAIMAPTSILAEQHYRNLTNLMAAPDEGGHALLQPGQIRLLIGDTSSADKQEIRDGLADGSVRLVIGTHALIEDPILFKNLQLVVIDEQHRFGVAQRSALRSKGSNPHLLVMTATPIPRSLALTVYGDLDLTVMDEMPAGRQVIETHVLHPLERERAYQLIRSQVAQSHQAFIIYPLIEQGEKEEILAAVEDHQRLQKDIFPELKIGLLHGRMKPEEKDEVMRRFRDQEYNMLVSTSVVEVGVDIPNATVMLIEGANRFGLAQLHQFRGRVGRGEAKSFCLLIPDNEDELENERLAVMAETNDGFVLAEKDLQQRGPGEFLGMRQAGFGDLRMANLTDVHLIEKARQQAQNLFQIDPDLASAQHIALLEKVDRFWGAGRGDIS